MLTPQYLLPIHTELAIDLFAGGGGASTGIEQALDRAVDIAINHDPEAVSLHQANHPQTKHFVSDVFEVDPAVVTQGRPVGMLWASPDCKHFSKAKGGKPVSKKIRSLAWVVVKWAKAVRPRCIFLENVEEFQTWGPLGADDRPCPLRKGDTFKAWKLELEKLGYKIEHRELRACDFGAPTIRKRLFLVARCDGQPIVWPEPTHAAPGTLPVRTKKLKPWRTAAQCIDWSIPAPSIFERKKELADATCRRIAKGIMRYVVNAKDPFIVPQAGNVHPLTSATMIQTGYGEREGQAPRALDLGKPLGTVVACQKHAVVSAFLTKFNTGSVGFAADTPMHTITAGGEQARPGTAITQGLVTANLVHMGHGEGKDGGKRFSHGVRSVTDPLNTVTASGSPGAIVTSNLIKLRGDNVGSATDEPIPTLTAGGGHVGEVRAFLIKYYSEGGQDQPCTDPMHTIPTKDRLGLVTVRGEEYAIVDIGLRMLTPRELYRAQGFPESYQIDFGGDGKPLTKTAQVRMCGNSVCPPMSRAIVGANYSENHSAGRKAA
jgi:DNA (cytosine-5)-methyltransferase 1